MGSRSRGKIRPLYHPKYWPTWAGVLGMKALSRTLPWNVQVHIGRSAGWLFFHSVKFRRHVVDVNLRLCFPEKSPKQRNALALLHYQALGIGIFETCIAWWGGSSHLPPHEIEGREHLELASAKGKGVLLLTAHFTTLEISGRMFSDEMTLGGLFRHPDNPVVARQMRLGRLSYLRPAVEMNDLRGLIRALRDGHTMWFAPDQSRRSKFTEILPFFGVPAQTNTATSRLAQMTGAAVVPFFGVRRKDGTYVLKILPALEEFPSADVKSDAVRTSLLMEEYIRDAPEQYFWIHRRFKKRGTDLPDVYRKNRPEHPIAG